MFRLKLDLFSEHSEESNPSPALAKKIAAILEVQFDDIFSLVEGD